MLGPCGDPKCPECNLSFGHGVPADEPLMLRCGNCKNVWLPVDYLNKKVLYFGEVYFLREFVGDRECRLAESIDGKPTVRTKTKNVRLLETRIYDK
ncbi:hypothetical protein C4577_03015 [Candidatus Parcubacteria bacterium]|nr:MAG: hypothetical protein C4577_03015 [Candidatus Parcubacteria bacterium]